MKWIWEHKKLVFSCIFVALLVILLSQAKITFLEKETQAAGGNTQAQNNAETSKDLPQDSRFRTIAENDVLRLKFEDVTAHFIVEDKRNGHIWRSYPNPEQWDNLGISGSWIGHMQSPVMLQYIDFTNPNAQPKDTNFVREQGKVADIVYLDDGVSFVLEMPTLGFRIPVQIRIEDDYVETSILDAGLEENGKESLLWLRLYPFFSAEQSVGVSEGYMFVPDGSGALLNFQKQQTAIKQIYQERIYGSDAVFINNPTSRYSVKMPVFGMKKENKAFLAVVVEGEVYTDILASPAGVYSNYNWIGTQQYYRMKYFHITNKANGTGFDTYTKDSRFGENRVIRYYLLDTDQADYAGMASRYREYLMEEKGLERIQPTSQDIPMYVSIIGADTQPGVITDRYVKATTFSEAMQMLQELYGLGVSNMHVTYHGWQKGGYSALGGYLGVDKRIGGVDGLKHFIEFAHSLDIPVHLAVNYGFNNTHANGFVARYHATRDLSGTIWSARLDNGTELYEVSKKFILQSVKDDLDDLSGLGIDGLLLEGVGTYVHTDYNTRFGGMRAEVLRTDQEILSTVKSKIDSLQLTDALFYTIGEVDHMNWMNDDYSYDLFSARAVPFAQIVLHGLITYTSSPENMRYEYGQDFLKDIEYGAYPSFEFTKAMSADLTGLYMYGAPNSSFDDWKADAVEQYQRYNEVFATLQDQFIIDHKQLAEGVFVTVYEDGTSVYVNYNSADRTVDGRTVQAMGYTVVKGEMSR